MPGEGSLPQVIVQCSTGCMPSLAGGQYCDLKALLHGARKLGWPSIELRVWEEWGRESFTYAVKCLKDWGISVGSIHAPPDTERLLCAWGREEEALALMEACAGAAGYADAILVVHAWDLRLPSFDMDALISNIRTFLRSPTGQGVELSIEAIPGHTKVLPHLLETLPEVSVTIDTQWGAFEDSWDYLQSIGDRVRVIHVQTLLEADSAGLVCLGRTRTGHAFDCYRILGRFLKKGFRGLITLEPQNVTGDDCDLLRNTLLMLKNFTAG